MTAALPPRAACRTMVNLLALAQGRACEAALAERPTAELDAGPLSDMTMLRILFAPASAVLSAIVITAPPLSLYNELATAAAGAHACRGGA